jgi:biopolymer transport protein ExbD
MENLSKKVRSNKITRRTITLIIIASISFLLVIFFMVMIQLNEPVTMKINLPQNGKINNVRIDEKDHVLITILLGENDKLIYYTGVLESPKETKYGKNGIGKELALQNENMLKNSSKDPKFKNLSVIIKPSKKSTYKNLVSILDEMTIAKIDSYAIVPEFTSEETKLLASN